MSGECARRRRGRGGPLAAASAAVDAARPAYENERVDRPLYASGQVISGTVYRVVRHLASGGMGSVFDVEDTSVGKRYVLKTLHPQLVSRQDLAKRMEAEARTLAKLQHPNIVDVVTAGITKDDLRVPYYVMERLNGQNLRVRLEKTGALDLAAAYRIAIDVLDALEHAHENQVIHRDVKPENIFLHRNVAGATVTKLLDFGIMRLLDRKASHTQGKFIGTLRYASPEQIMGEELGPPTDIYSLGIVLYEMVCGRGPFDDVGDAYAIGAAHAQRPPPPLSRFVQVPPDLERLVMASLAKAPAERPRDAFTFAGELRRLLREVEAAPRSVTAVGVLSSVPQTRAASQADPFTGTAASPVPSTRRDVPVLAQGTEQGMPPPSAVGDTLLEASGAPVVSTEAVAPTMVAAGLHASGAGLVDRQAETRAAAPFGQTQRMAMNGTAIDDGPAPAEVALRASLAARGALEGPPASGGGRASHPSGEIGFPSSQNYPTGTGPLSGEARTRPPETSMGLPLAAAGIVGVLLVGGAALAVTKPWVKRASPGAPAEVAATVATTAPAPPAPLGAESATAAAPAAQPAPKLAAPAPSAEGAASAPTPTPPPPKAATTSAAPKAARPRAEPAAPAPKPAVTTKKPGAPRPEDVGFD